jgi:4'-phosphopantetheinyl transferase
MGIGLDGDECRVWWARVEGGGDGLVGRLDAVERDRWQRLRNGRDRDRYAVAHATARTACGLLLGVAPERVRWSATCRYCAGAHGRLGVDLAGGRLCVSLSHSGTRVAVAAAWGTEVGIDVEEIALRGEPPLTALSEVERRHLATLAEPARPAGFIRYWTRKEAVLKATGDGLLVPPRRLTVSPPGAPAAVLDWVDRPPPRTPVFLTDLDPGPGYQASLATLGRRLRVVTADATALLAR